MTGDEGGYILDVEYTADFFPHLAPARLAYIAAINGYGAPRLDGRFTWCELGCGQGLTSLILAATHPSGEFHACDFNAAHIERAEALRVAGSVDNLRLHSRSFRELLDETLPPFDFIVAHGMYGWVGEGARADVREFIRRRLRPGGLVMISYNAMPGWAHVAPIRRMMRAHAETIAGSSLDKAPLNSALVEAAIRGQRQHVPLACPLNGSACDTEVVSASAIEAAARTADAEHAARHALGRLRAARYPVNRLSRSGERRPATDDEITEHVLAVWRSLRDPANADRRRLQQFGVLG